MNKVLMAGVGLLALAVVVGCESNSDTDLNGGGSGDTVPVGTVPNVAGTWQLTDLTYGKNATIVLSQDGQVLTGTIANVYSRHGTIQGTITSAGAIQMRFTFPKGETDVTVHLSGNTMSGSWVDHRDGAVAEIVGAKS